MEDSRYGYTYAVIAAAGKGSRMGLDVPKQLLYFDGSTVLETSVRAFASNGAIDTVVIVSPQDGSLDGIYAEIAARLGSEYGKDITVTRGGSERGESTRAGIAAAEKDALSKGIDPRNAIVLVHDAARPGVSADIIERNIEAMRSAEACVTAIRAADTIRVETEAPASENPAGNSTLSLKDSPTYPIMNTNVVDRNTIYRVQTPQTFVLAGIAKAYEMAERDGFTATDDAQIAEHAGMKVVLVEGSPANSKITTKEDIHMAARIGSGYDVHCLVPDRPLILLGTPIPSNLGLGGHSDADVAAHALMDALLGAAGLGDIGRHFPDTDDRYKGADSMKLLAEVRDMLGDAKIGNVDITIIAQAPKLAPYMDQMKQNVSEVLGIPAGAVNVKATTEEGLGFTGRGEGIAAMAVCIIEGSF